MDPDDLPDRIAGLRTVRPVGAGARARMLLLQHPDGLVAKLWHATTPRPDIDRELAALARVDDPHLLRLIDVDVLPDGRIAALLPRVGRSTALRLLERRAELSYGEAVTLVAPVAAAVAALHRAGVAHGRVGPARILLDDSGAPVLAGFGDAALFPPGLSPSVRADRTASDVEALRRFSRNVLERVGGADGVHAERVAAVVDQLDGAEFPRTLVEALFESGRSGEPLRFPAEDAPPLAPGGGRVVPPSRTREVATPSDPRAGPSRAADRGRAIRLVSVLERGTAGVRAALTERWRALPRPRRLLMVAGAAALTAAVSAGVLVPAARPDPTVDRARAATAASAATSTPPRSSPRPTPPRSSPRPETSAIPDPRNEGRVVRGDDPVAATPVLLAARERCIREDDLQCLASVDERGSPAELADGAAAAGRAPMASPQPPFRLIERLGGAAMVSGAAHRMLLVRGASGWRIREIVDAVPAP